MRSDAAERRRKRLKRYINSLPEEQRVLSPEDRQKLVDEGLADDDGLTPAGELRLHQLELLDEWINRIEPRRAAKKAIREAEKALRKLEYEKGRS